MVLADRDARPVRELTADAAERIAELAGLGSDLVEGQDEGSPRVLMADLLGYHRRDAKPEWWAYFDRLERLAAGALRRGRRGDRRPRARGRRPAPRGRQVVALSAALPAAAAQDRPVQEGRSRRREAGAGRGGRRRAWNPVDRPRQERPRQAAPQGGHPRQADPVARPGRRAQAAGRARPRPRPRPDRRARRRLRSPRGPGAADRRPPVAARPVELGRLSAQVEGLEDSACSSRGRPARARPTWAGG